MVLRHMMELGLLLSRYVLIQISYFDVILPAPLALQGSKKVLDPVAPIYKYCAISVSNILTTTCQYEVSCILWLVERNSL